MRHASWLLAALLTLGVLGAEAPKLRVGDVAPDFTLPDLADQNYSLSACAGKVVVLEYWATWCPDCRKSLPYTQKLATSDAAKAGDLVVVTIPWNDKKDQVADYLKAHDYTYRTLLDPKGTVGKRYQVSGIPRYVVIGVDGKIRFTDAAEFEPKFEARLDEAITKALAEVKKDG